MGPLKLAFAGTIDILEKNEGGHRVVMKATGSEEKGKGQASATVTSTMQQAGGGTRVMLSQDIQMTGAIAQYGRGMMQDVIGSLMKQFANCAAGDIARPGSAARGGGGAPKGVALKMIVDYQTIAAGMLFTLAMGRLGGLVPALSAMRMEILDSLR